MIRKTHNFPAITCQEPFKIQARSEPCGRVLICRNSKDYALTWTYDLSEDRHLQKPSYSATQAPEKFMNWENTSYEFKNLLKQIKANGKY